MNIADNLFKIQHRISAYEKKYQRVPHSVSLLAASKGQSIDKITAAYMAGQRLFGENYLQEALNKITALSLPAIEWHFIGPMQSNKTKKIAAHFAWVHSVDNMKIAQRLNDQRPAHLPPLNICIEVNVSNESSKSGVEIHELMTLVNFCHALPRLRLRGLMTIPAAHSDLAKQRAEFHKLSVLYHDLRAANIALDTLSMGMSGDLEAAIAEGATIVRIGTGIFGQR